MTTTEFWLKGEKKGVLVIALQAHFQVGWRLFFKLVTLSSLGNRIRTKHFKISLTKLHLGYESLHRILNSNVSSVKN